MAIWLNAWSGDNAGKVEGREAYRALVSLTHSEGDFPAGLFQTGDLDGTTWYYNFYATCLTPGSMAAIVTKVEDVGDYVWSVEVTPHDWGDKSRKPWAPGVHLFSLMLLAPGGNQSGTIASVIVGPKAKKPLRLSEAGTFAMLETTRKRMRAFE